MNGAPEGRVMESVTGLKESFPENAMAVTTVGDARKFMVLRLPSLRDLKFLMNELLDVLRQKVQETGLPVERSEDS